MKDYSQTGEQAAILSIFGYAGASDYGPGKERFLDIGAWNAESLSNTRALYELGWTGVVFEPSPGPLRELVKVYGQDLRVIVVGAAVTVKPELVRLLITDDAVSCVPDSEGAEVWKEKGGFFGMMYTPGFSVVNIMNQFGGFDFVNIDTEGTSVDIFAEMLRIGFRPGGFCIEHNDRFVEMAGHAQEYGYGQVLLNGNNAVLENKNRARKGE